MATRQAYWIGVTQEEVDKINAIKPWDTSILRLPKGALGGNDPPDDVNLLSFRSGLFCFDSADPELVYELVKFIAENEEELSRRARGYTFDGATLARLAPGFTKDALHPGSLRYFEEQGL